LALKITLSFLYFKVHYLVFRFQSQHLNKQITQKCKFTSWQKNTYTDEFTD